MRQVQDYLGRARAFSLPQDGKWAVARRPGAMEIFAPLCRDGFLFWILEVIKRDASARTFILPEPRDNCPNAVLLLSGLSYTLVLESGLVLRNSGLVD